MRKKFHTPFNLRVSDGVFDIFTVLIYLSDWHKVIKLGAIDCAQEENMPACRDYEVMGYPTLKFFPPAAAAEDLGEVRKSMDKSVAAIKEDMVAFVDKIFANITNSGGRWPVLEPFR